MLNRLQKDPPAGIAAVPSDDNILIWHAFILGLVDGLIRERDREISAFAFPRPNDTPFEDGTFRLLLGMLRMHEWIY